MIYLIRFIFTAFFVMCFYSCKSQSAAEVYKKAQTVISDTAFVNLKEYSVDFVYDMKYATTDNFLKAKVYDCAECYLRLKTVKALIAANKEFIEKGYRIKLFDCYRPLAIQKRMWEIVSNPQYVADPAKGSIHNRGGAVDITLVDKNGKELDMGTPFDFFGAEAGHNYANLSKKIKNNRKFLKKIMDKHHFKALDSEWWHYNLQSALKDKVANTKWDCE
ncbi:M15 family metallopeptidase [Flavobacterium sp. ARAG 55.4]|uniref:M15 family metallopeptidase n=1 Tax=Flavobacterium sp. ARAG 55.4 TaxID=3451357 RepID=UPI003F48FDB3